MESGKLKTRLEFSELPSDEKCHVLFAHVLRSQARKFGGSVVAIVDAGSLAGIRRHWNTPVPLKIAELSDECFAYHYSDDDLDYEVKENVIERHVGRRHLLADKHAVAVGAGATTVGVTSLSKAVPVSTLYGCSFVQFSGLRIVFMVRPVKNGTRSAPVNFDGG